MHKHDPHNDGTFSPVEIIVLLILAGASIVFVDLIFYPSTLEDAYITFRYSEHLAEGHGFGAWNIGEEPVEGYTSFFWMVLLGGVHALGIDVRTAAKLIGILMHLVLCSVLIAFPLLRRRSRRFRGDLLEASDDGVLAGIFLAFYLPLSWYATSGMETLFFSALSGLALASVFLRHGSILLPVLAILLLLTRPEGIVIAAAAIVLDLAVRHREGRSLRVTFVSAGGTIITLGLLVLHRVVVFEEIVPNSYWAKAGGASLRHASLGLLYVSDWARIHLVVVFVCVAGLLKALFLTNTNRGRHRDLGYGIVWCLVLFFIAYIIKVGGDNDRAFPYWRHFVQLSAPVAFLCCYAIVRMRRGSRFFNLLSVILIVLTTNLAVLRAHDNEMLASLKVSLASFPSLSHAEHNAYFQRLKDICQTDTLVASSLGGELPYVVDAKHIDILGLNTSHIAKYGSFDPQGPQDSKTDMAWVLAQHPDIIEGYIPGTMVLKAEPEELKRYLETNWRSKMHQELVSSPAFQREYLFVRNWPYGSLDRALFIRRSFLEDRQLQDRLDGIPVADTPLGRYAKSLMEE